MTGFLGSFFKERKQTLVTALSNDTCKGTGKNLPQNPFHPSHNFMTGWVRGLIEINDTRTDVGFEIALEGRTASGDRCEMAAPNEH